MNHDPMLYNPDQWPDGQKRKKTDPLMVIGGNLEGPELMAFPPLAVVEEEEEDPNP